jgi:hypothetical protein
MFSIRLDSVHDQVTAETWHNTKVSDAHVLGTPRTLIGPARDTPQAGSNFKKKSGITDTQLCRGVVYDFERH